MAELNLDVSGWKDFWQRFGAIAQDFPRQKRELLGRVGDRLAQEVSLALRRSRIRDTTGRVASWQNPHVGPGGGYVAVRADSVEVAAGGSHSIRMNAGRLTGYLERGHPVRKPSGRSQRYRPRARMARVPGFGFYQQAGARTQAIGLEEAQRLLERLEADISK